MRNRRSVGCSAAVIGALCAATFTASCAKDITTSPPPTADETVSALFDPSLSILPTPTDLAKNQVTGLLAVPVADESKNPAQAEFDRYLNTLDGFPAISSVNACFSGELDKATIKDNFKVIKLDAAGGLPVLQTDIKAADPVKTLACPVLTATSCNVADKTGCTAEQICVTTTSATAVCANAGYRVTFKKAVAWERGASYAFYVTNGVKTIKNKPIIRSSAFEIAAGPNPLCEYNETEQTCTYNYSALLASQVKAGVTAVNDAKREKNDANDPPLTEEQLEAAIKKEILSSGTRFERLRRAYAQLLGASQAAGVNAADVVLAWSFSVVSLTEAIFDPAGGNIPGPGNDLIYDAATKKVNIPARPGETPEDKALREGLNTLDGFSTMGRYYAAFSGKLDATKVKNTADGVDLIVANLTNPLEPPQAAFAFVDNAGAITFTPTVPLAENSQYAVLLRSRGNDLKKADLTAQQAMAATGGLTDATGRRVVASPVFALVRSRNSLVDKDGKSVISILDDASAKALEAIRSNYDKLLSGLELNPAIKPQLNRDDITVLWTFTTQTITAPLTQLRALPYSTLAAADSNAPKLAGGIDPTLASWPPAAPKDKVGGLGKGTFKTWMAIDPTTGALLPDPTKGKIVDVPFLISMPTLADCSTAVCTDSTATCADLMDLSKTPPVPTGIKRCVPAKIPVVVFQHGITRAKTDFFAVANALAGAGYATLAFDINFHGERSICATDADCIGTASCSAAKKCCDKTTTECKTDYFVDLDKDTVPDVSGGAAFLNTANPFAIRDNFRQQVIDASAFFRAIALGGASGLQWPLVDLSKAGAPVPIVFAASNVNYVGQSLGSIIGTSVLATDSTVKRAVLNVPGAPLVKVFEGTNAPSFIALVDGLLDARGLCKDEGGKKICPRDSLGAFQLFHTLQWIVDPADAGNFAAYVKTKSLKDEVASAAAGKDVMVTKKEVLVQVAGLDNVIPTPLEIDLARWMGVDITDTTYAKNDHGFLLAPSPKTEAAATAAAQTQMVKFLLTGTVCKPDTTTGACN